MAVAPFHCLSLARVKCFSWSLATNTLANGSQCALCYSLTLLPTRLVASWQPASASATWLVSWAFLPPRSRSSWRNPFPSPTSCLAVLSGVPPSPPRPLCNPLGPLSWRTPSSSRSAVSYVGRWTSPSRPGSSFYTFSPISPLPGPCWQSSWCAMPMVCLQLLTRLRIPRPPPPSLGGGGGPLFLATPPCRHCLARHCR